MLNNKELFDIVTDLRRCVLCLSRNNISSAQAFFNHANVLVKQLNNPESLSKKMQLDLRAYWDKLYTADIQNSSVELEHFSENILTLSSLIFIRTLYA